MIMLITSFILRSPITEASWAARSLIPMTMIAFSIVVAAFRGSEIVCESEMSFADENDDWKRKRFVAKNEEDRTSESGGSKNEAHSRCS